MSSTVFGPAWRSQGFFSHDITSARAADVFNESASCPMEIQVPEGFRPDFRVEGGCGHALSVWRSESASGIYTVPRSQADALMFRFVTRGRGIRSDRRHQLVGDPSNAMFASLDEMMNEDASADYSAIGGTISNAALEAAHLDLEGDLAQPRSRREPMTAARTPAMTAFMLSLCSLHDRITALQRTSDILLPILEEVIIYQLLSCWPSPSSAPEARRVPSGPAYVARAVDYIEAHLATPLKLSDVAASVGISVRMLQLAFKREMSTTPLTYLNERRLQHVHRDLSSKDDCDQAIAVIARRWGFNHMGDFAQRYRARFGYAPGRTPSRQP